MILGLGTDLCPPARWAHLLERFGEKAIHRVLHPEEAAYLLKGNPQRLPERLAGRWALREAFGKALGVGLDGWSWKELRYLNGRLWAEGALSEQLIVRKIQHLHGSVTHDAGFALAVVVLEGDPQCSNLMPDPDRPIPNLG
jgi:holo-[acyl-carrier protein] synthase